MGLPSGISLSTNGALSVTNTMGSTNVFARIMVSNTNGSDSRVVAIQVSPAAPSAPTDLTESGVTTLGFTANWTGTANNTAGYTVELATSSNNLVSGVLFASTNVGITSASFTNLDLSVSTWAYRVKDRNSGLYSAVQGITNLFGSAVILDGVNDNFRIATTNAPLSGDFTLSFWMKANDLLANYQVVLQNLNGAPMTAGLDMDLLANGRISFGQMRTNPMSSYVVGTATNLIQANKWYHIALVRETGSTAPLKIFVNGTNQSWTNTGSFQNLGVTTNALAFGASSDAHNTGASKFKGQIDDVRLYNAARNASEIQADLSRPLTDGEISSSSALIFYAKLDSNFTVSKGTLETGIGTPSAAFVSPGRSPGAWDFASGDYTLRNDGTSLLLELGGLEGTTLY
ncbi:MAG: LamG domain-containing protein, partial [Verrucomicrobia bacterium]|nr:LamG domain-containing protein [Verrucomicrobiota bacterium]